MLRKIGRMFWAITVMSVILAGCGNREENLPVTDDKKLQMPDIVFYNYVDYLETAEEGGVQSAMTFYDKNGNHYTSTDPYVCSLYLDKLVKEYAEGTLDDKIEFHTICDVDELYENYEKLCEVSRNKELEIIYPEYGPTVLANRQTWYGAYYDAEGELQSILLHEKNAHGNHEANDERANEIYEWYIGTFQ